MARSSTAAWLTQRKCECPVFGNHLPPVIQPRLLSKPLCPAVTSAVSRCDPRSLQAGSVALPKRIALYQESREVPGDNAVCGFSLRAGKKVSVKKKSGSKTLIKIYTNPKKLKVQWLNWCFFSSQCLEAPWTYKYGRHCWKMDPADSL